MTLKACMQHWVFEYFQICSNDEPELTLTYFTARSNLIPYAFVWEKGKIMDFSETIVVCDIKVGRFSLLNEYMNHYEYQRSGLTLTIFMTGSNLFLNASAWVKAYTGLSANVFPSLF